MPLATLPVPLAPRRALLDAVASVACFHAAYSVPGLGLLIVPSVVCLAQLARLSRTLHAFFAGWLTALACVAPQLAFFYGIFGAPAWTLWAILAAWMAGFVTLLHFALRRLPPLGAALLTPFLWMGLETFRSELYPLRFSWLNVGYALGGLPSWEAFGSLGVYGCGFLAAALAAGVLFCQPRWFVVAACVLAFLPAAFVPARAPRSSLRVAGVQLEHPSTARVLENLDGLARTRPDTPLYVLSEYTFDGPVPASVRAWCREHGKYLVAGGTAPAAAGRYYNTAFVVGPGGDIVFQQAKSVPIQFFDDGLPADGQRLWSSPWGRIGLCICYDLSYRRVTDQLVAQGAQALIVPTMDAETWGEHEHLLHTRVAPVRAAEYGIPIFRLASSGISQAVDARGREIARAPFPGDGAVLTAELAIGSPGTLPLDRFLIPPSLCATLGFCLYLLFWSARAVTGQLLGKP